MSQYGSMVGRLQQDLPELLVLRFAAEIVAEVATTNVIERCFCGIRRRTRPMVCFVNVASVESFAPFSAFQFVMEKPHLQTFYTRRLTSPGPYGTRNMITGWFKIGGLL